MGHLARDLAEAVDAAAALGRRIGLGPRHGDSRHAEKKARIDAIVAGLDAFARKHARVGPLARRFIALAETQNVDDAVDHVARLGGDAAGSRDRTDFDAFAAAGARIDHAVDAGLQRGFERLGHSCHEVRSHKGAAAA